MRHLLRFLSPLNQKIEALHQKLKVQEDLDELDELADLETKLFGLIMYDGRKFSLSGPP